MRLKGSLNLCQQAGDRHTIILMRLILHRTMGAAERQTIGFEVLIRLLVTVRMRPTTRMVLSTVLISSGRSLRGIELIFMTTIEKTIGPYFDRARLEGSGWRRCSGLLDFNGVRIASGVAVHRRSKPPKPLKVCSRAGVRYARMAIGQRGRIIWISNLTT
jgi:hypothetical protein